MFHWIKTCAVVFLFTQIASAADFTPGNLVVFRAGNGTSPTQLTSVPAALVELSPSGTVVQTINLPSTGGGTLFTTPYQSRMTDGWLSRSGNGEFLTVGGYNTTVGTINANISNAFDRVIARVGTNGIVDLSTRVGTNNARPITGAATNDGTRMWYGSDSPGGQPALLTTTFGASGTGTTLISGAPNDAYALRIFNGQLYGTDLNSNIVRTTTPLPTSATSFAPVVAYGSAGGTLFPGEFVFLDRNAGVPGNDTLYVAGENGLQKFSFDGANWTARGSLAGQYYGLSGSVSGVNARFFATTGTGQVTNNLFGTFTDTAAYNANISAAFTSLGGSAGINMIYLGVAFAPQPVPEPSLLLTFLGGLALIVRIKF